MPCAANLQNWLNEKGEKKYRFNQIRRWVFAGRARTFDDMSDLPTELRKSISDDFEFFSTEIVRQHSAGDQTRKLLLQLPDQSQIECVLLFDGKRRTICVSSQVGCAMGCVFCASGLDGVKRNLTAAEIVEQMLRLQHCLPAEERLSHIVMMGMGEPLANVDNVLEALDVATSPAGFGISPRRVTISTVGLPPAIEKLARHGKPYNLAVSLHAPNDELRTRLVPVNRKTGIDAILKSAERYFEITGRRLTFEYVLLGDVNDSPSHARQLAQLLQNTSSLVNVIPYNKVAGLPWNTPRPEKIDQFGKILRDANINVQFRLKKGDEISAACGQLRRQQTNTSGPGEITPATEITSGSLHRVAGTKNN